jgi:hypothetical protein
MTPVITRLKCISAGLMIFCFLVTGTTFAQKTGSQTKAAYTISGITLDQTADGLQLVVQGGTPPTYTMYELFDPCGSCWTLPTPDSLIPRQFR